MRDDIQSVNITKYISIFVMEVIYLTVIIRNVYLMCEENFYLLNY